MWSSQCASRVIGVVDLKKGQSVHAIAGQRDDYQPICINPICVGCPLALVDHYRKQSVRSIYIADLDSLCGGDIQFDDLEKLVRYTSQFEEILIDVGYKGTEQESSHDRLVQLISIREGLRLIVATETASSIESLSTLVEKIGSAHIALGLDYRDSHFITNAQSESEWIDDALEQGVRILVMLDTASVGTGAGPTIYKLCGHIVRQHPGIHIYSGGGIRNQSDVQRFLDNGVSKCLVATALLPSKPTRKNR